MKCLALPLQAITADTHAQPRIMLNQFLVDDYAAAMREGIAFPPVTVFSDGERHWLADGFHRYQAARQAGLETLQAEVHDGDLRAAILFSCGANIHHGLRRTNADKRRAVLILLEDPEWSQWSNRHIAEQAAVSLDLVNRLRTEASERIVQMDSTRKVTRCGSRYLMNVTRIGDSRKIVPEARQLLSLTDVAEDRREIARLSGQSPDVQIEVARRITGGEANHVDMALKQLNYERKIETSLNDVVQGRYPVLYADPPWKFDAGDGLRGSAGNQYPCMTIEEISALPVIEKVTQDAVLFLWSTNTHLPDAFRVLDAWGFQYVANIAWVKNTLGVGFYLRGKHELLLLGVRGALQPKEAVPSVLEADTRGHSVKPDEAYDIIERMYPDMPAYLEMFARRSPARPRWVAWGNEPEVLAPRDFGADDNQEGAPRA